MDNAAGLLRASALELSDGDTLHRGFACSHWNNCIGTTYRKRILHQF